MDFPHAPTSRQPDPETVEQLELAILEALASEPSLSQRQLAARAGLSLTRAHFVLKKLVARQLVSVHSAPRSGHKLGYLYLLTPEGTEEKARLTYSALQRTATAYRSLVERLSEVWDRARGQLRASGLDELAVLVAGSGALADAVRAELHARKDARLVDDPSTARVVLLTGPRPDPPPPEWAHIELQLDLA